MGKVLSSYLLPHPPIILEDIGKGEEEKAINTIEGVQRIAKDIKDKAPTTIIVITPHGPVFSDAIAISVEDKLYGDFGSFGFNNLKYKYNNNLDLVESIIEESYKNNIIMAEVDKNFSKNYNINLTLDHGVLVPLHFVDKYYKDYKLIHITYGLLSPADLYRFGQVVKNTINQSHEDVVVIASGDLSHKLSSKGPYKYSPDGEIFDKRLVNILREANMEELIQFDMNLAERAGECGLRSLMIMAGIMDQQIIKSEVISYEAPFGVGYCTAKFELLGDKEEDILKRLEEKEKTRILKIREQEDELVKLARESLEYYIKNNKVMETPNNLSDKLVNTRNAVFVTIKKDGQLRGCIGTTEPRRKNIVEEIINNAISAGTKDPRFDPVEEYELDELIYSVDVLSSPEPIQSIKELDVINYGVIVKKGMRKGLLLPNLQGVDTVEEQVDIALEKAGIRANEKYNMERFKVVRYE